MTITDIQVKCEGMNGCSSQADFLVRVHQTDSCDTPDCLDGNRTFTMCAKCTKWLSGVLASYLVGILDKLPADSAREIECSSCDKTITTVRDLFHVEAL